MTTLDRRRKIKSLIEQYKLDYEFFYDNFRTKQNTYYRWKRGVNAPETDEELKEIEAKIIDLNQPVDELKQADNAIKQAKEVIQTVKKTAMTQDEQNDKIIRAIYNLEGSFNQLEKTLNLRMKELEDRMSKIEAIEEHEHGPEGFKQREQERHDIEVEAKKKENSTHPPHQEDQPKLKVQM